MKVDTRNNIGTDDLTNVGEQVDNLLFLGVDR